MRKLEQIWPIAAVIVGVVVLGVVVGWLGSRGPKPEHRPSPPVAAPGPDQLTPAESVPAPPKPAATPSPAPALVQHAGAAPAAQTNLAANLITNWEDQVDQILTSDGDDAQKAKQMLAMFPRLSADAQSEVAQHLSNLVPDNDYAALGRILADPNQTDDVLDVLLSDLLNRPNSVKLPLLLEVARDPQHPKAGEAKDLLELFLEEDYAKDWPKWQAKMNEWLKENPD